MEGRKIRQSQTRAIISEAEVHTISIKLPLPKELAPLLVYSHAWGIRCRVIGVDISYLSVGDDNIVSLLHQLKQPTLFTRDEHFFSRSLRHDGYCLVWLEEVLVVGRTKNYQLNLAN